jgi:hypothetical protein
MRCASVHWLMVGYRPLPVECLLDLDHEGRHKGALGQWVMTWE